MAAGSKFYTFTWDIVDPEYNPQRIIESPSFTIPPFSGVLWCLRVELLDPGNVHEINCYLHRMQSMTGPDFIFADFLLEVTGSAFRETYMDFINVKFMNKEPNPDFDPSFKMNVKVRDKTLKLSFELRLVCSFTKLDANNEQSNNPGYYYMQMENLSENILSLLSTEHFSNLILRVQGRCFFTHKAIILARLPKLALAIPGINFLTKSEYEVIGTTPTIIECFLYYAYSGTLLPACYTHLREVYSAAEKYELKDVQQLLKCTSNRCYAKTTMNIQSKSFMWIMEPNTWITGLKKKLILPGNVGHVEDIIVGYNISEISGEKLLELDFEFPKLHWDCPIFMNCNVICMNDTETLFEEKFLHLFTSKDICTSHPLICETFFLAYNSPITFRVEIELCGAESKSCIEEIDATIPTPLLYPKNIEKLSNDLENLFSSSKCCDVTLKTHNLSIHAHKAILAARSKGFLDKFLLHPDETIFFFTRITDSTLKYIINYIYTGSPKGKADTNYLKELKMVASSAGLFCLVSELSSKDDDASF